MDLCNYYECGDMNGEVHISSTLESGIKRKIVFLNDRYVDWVFTLLVYIQSRHSTQNEHKLFQTHYNGYLHFISVVAI